MYPYNVDGISTVAFFVTRRFNAFGGWRTHNTFKKRAGSTRSGFQTISLEDKLDCGKVLLPR